LKEGVNFTAKKIAFRVPVVQ